MNTLELMDGAVTKKSKTPLALMLALLLGCLQASVDGQSNIATWYFSGTVNSANPVSGFTSQQNMSVGSLSKSSALGAQTAQNVFYTTGHPLPLQGFPSSKYITFSVTPDTKYRIAYDRIEMDIIFNTVLPGSQTSWRLASSIDDFATVVASGTVGGGGGIFPVSADISSLGTRTGSVSFRLYFVNNVGFSPGLRGLFDRLDLRGTLSQLPQRYPGTGEDLETRYQLGLGPVVTVDSRIPASVDDGVFVTVTHDSPGGAFDNTGQLLVLASFTTTGNLVPSPFPGLHLDLNTASVIFANDAFGSPMTLPTAGISYSFLYPGTLDGITGVIQCLVADQGASNGIFAASDALEIDFE